MYKVSFFVPKDQADPVKAAMFIAGGGKIGHYDCCSFETEGTGQFRPLAGARPAIGSVNELEKIVELKVEMVCEDHCLKEVVWALKKNHPYETPAYDIIKLIDL